MISHPSHRICTRRTFGAHGLWVSCGLVLALGCEQIIGADFDPKTVHSDYFNGGGQGGQVGTDQNRTGGTQSVGVERRRPSLDKEDEQIGGAGPIVEIGNSGGGDHHQQPGSGGMGESEGDGGTGSGGTSSGPTCSFADPECSVEVVINEIRGQGGTDFIELYNRGHHAVDLKGYSITDGTSYSPDPENRLVIPDQPTDSVTRTVISPQGYLFFQAREERICLADNCGGLMSFAISAGGEHVFLLDPALNIVDEIDYPDEHAPGGLINGQSWGRFPDGGNEFGAMSPPSPGSANNSFDP